MLTLHDMVPVYSALFNRGVTQFADTYLVISFDGYVQVECDEIGWKGAEPLMIYSATWHNINKKSHNQNISSSNIVYFLPVFKIFY